MFLSKKMFRPSKFSSFSCQFYWLVATCQQIATNLSISSSCNKSVIKSRLKYADRLVVSRVFWALYTKSKSLSYRYNHVNLGSVVLGLNSAMHRIVIFSNLLNMLRTRAKIHQVDATLFVEQRLNNVVIKVQQHLLN